MHSREINRLWQDMEGAAAGHGLLRRRLEPQSGFDLFVTVDKPSNTRGVQLRMENAPGNSENGLPRIRGIQLGLREDSSSNHTKILEIRLDQAEFKDIFAVVVSDLVDTLVSSTSHTALEVLLDRLHSWQRFMERYSYEGLSTEAQKGLYGEIYFLITHLGKAIGMSAAVRAWTGPDRADQDFQLKGAAVEVKTTATAQPQQLSISSERQLDDSGLDTLSLFHLSLDARAGSGQTLNALIQGVREKLGGWNPSRALFEDGLIKSGYLEAHRRQYETTGYRSREENLFRVTGAFPRILESDLRSGVGNVRYSIALSGGSSYRIEMALLEELLAGEHDDG